MNLRASKSDRLRESGWIGIGSSAWVEGVEGDDDEGDGGGNEDDDDTRDGEGVVDLFEVLGWVGFELGRWMGSEWGKGSVSAPGLMISISGERG